MEFDKDKLVALIGTIAFHLVIFLILFFIVLTSVVPEEDTGILVNFGNVELSTGLYEPRGNPNAGADVVSVPEVTAPPVRTTQPAQTSTEDIITQNSEESVAIANQRRADEERRQREETERRQREAVEQRERVAREQEAQRQRDEQAIRDRVAGAFGIGDTDSQSQGSGTTGTGNEGSPFGNSDTGPNTGVGGFGGSILNLNGRSIRDGSLSRPSGTFDESGTIVVDITVDSKGDVIQAEIGRGTNISNAAMRSSAIEAAKRAKFNSIAGANNQVITIKFNYFLR